MKNEIKKLILIKLLGLSISLIPKNNAGFKLLNAIIEFLETDLKN